MSLQGLRYEILDRPATIHDLMIYPINDNKFFVCELGIYIIKDWQRVPFIPYYLTSALHRIGIFYLMHPSRHNKL